MKVRILPSSPGAEHLQHLISFVVDGRVAVDAGCLGFCGTPPEQAAITAVLLTHSHMDHVCSLPIYAMNVMDWAGHGVTVHAPADVIATLRQDIFNWRIWPDFTSPAAEPHPLVTFNPIELRREIMVEGLAVTAIPIQHPVPTVGYVIDDGQSAVVFALDTGPTREIWDVAARNPRLKAVFIDVAFPDDMSALAEVSGHLTPRQVGDQISALPESVVKVACHLKAAYYDRTVAELHRTRIPNLSICRPGFDYEF